MPLYQAVPIGLEAFILSVLSHLLDFLGPEEICRNFRRDSAPPKFTGELNLARGRNGLPRRTYSGRRRGAFTISVTLASVGATGGLSLLFVGKLLGHKQASTTQRYAHLAEDPVRQAGEQISEAIASALGKSSKVG